jgi:predicted ATPase/class 3 adenylate cyclase
MPPLPVGTLTLLFSDIEGSTSMLTGLGSRWAEALSAHRAILRASFAEHSGREVGTEGDSFFVVFPSATQGLLAAMAAQRGLADHVWPDGRALRVRMGLHTGEPQVSDDDYIGLDVVRAARIAAAAHGGQTLISEATHALATDALAGLAVRDLGWHRLKDLPERLHLFQVTPPGLPAEHPPLRSLGMSTNLPSYATELVGRGKEIDDVATMASRGVRLVTLTGSGGMGKTRLAVAVARELQRRSAWDVYFVPLQTADRAALMWAGIAEAVNAPAKVGQPPDARALDFLRDRIALLVLDNLEQIADADDVVGRLLSVAPGVSLLATSRRPLHLVEEQQYPLSTFAVPEWPRPSGDLADVGRNDAVTLFVERARMVRPDFEVTAENVADVVLLCRRLDGLPLAIELAAARSRLLGPKALLNHIDSWFGQTLSEAQRPERQRALTATMAWSYDMLTEEDRRAFRQLGVFSSRVGLDAVEVVVALDGREPLEVVARLNDVSLLDLVQAQDGEPLGYMLQTIRRFALERLGQAGELEETRLRHARWCRGVTQQIAGILHGPRQMSALDRMEAVMEDVRSALDWAFTPGGALGETQFACGLDLLEPMDNYWYRFGYTQEGRGWHEQALALLDRGGREDSTGTVDALHGHGMLAVQQNDLATGSQALERALEISHRLGDLGREAREANGLGVAVREQGDAVRARELVERSLELARRIGDPYREAVGLANLVDIHLDLGEYASAVDAARRAVTADEALGDPWGVAVDKCNLATALLYAEGPGPAYQELVDVASGAIALGDIELSIDVLDCFAMVWAASGDGLRSAVALGAADEQRTLAGLPRTKPDAALLERVVVPVRQATKPADWDRSYARGRTLTIEAAVEEESTGEGSLYSGADLRETS